MTCGSMVSPPDRHKDKRVRINSPTTVSCNEKLGGTNLFLTEH